MTNLDRAAQVILRWQKRHQGNMDTNPEWSAQNLAIDLYVKGLLAPELLEEKEEKEENEH